MHISGIFLGGLDDCHVHERRESPRRVLYTMHISCIFHDGLDALKKNKVVFFVESRFITNDEND